MIVAVDALLVANQHGCQKTGFAIRSKLPLSSTYIADRARIMHTEIFVLGFIWRCQTMNPGRMQQVQSDQHVTAE
jgi:hypothetical protein